MQNIRAFVFYVLLLFSLVVGFFFLWFILLLPTQYIRHFSGLWDGYVVWLLKITCKVKVQVRGEHHRKQGCVIYASKHQSAFETFFLCYKIIDCVIFLKKELYYIPIFGWFLMRSGTIGMDRKKGVKSVQKMLKHAQKIREQKKPMLIFPEGTRQAVGAKPNYKSGVYMLYKNLHVPVVPIAHNAGLFWQKNTFKKTPGTVVVEFLPSIEPGLSKKDFMERLVTSIENKTNTLVKEGESMNV